VTPWRAFGLAVVLSWLLRLCGEVAGLGGGGCWFVCYIFGYLDVVFWWSGMKWILDFLRGVFEFFFMCYRNPHETGEMATLLALLLSFVYAVTLIL